jgi:replicative DNA helicase
MENENHENRIVTTGLHDLDKITGGFQPGQVIVLAARPIMGKTALVLEWAAHLAKQRGKIIALFELELTKDEIEKRLLPLDLDPLSASQIVVDDSPGLSATDIFERCKALKGARGRLDLVIVDYLQLMLDRGPPKKRNCENLRQLKEAAKILNCPIIVLSQVSRSLESRSDKRPILIDLRESAPIESNADIIMFIYRDDYYYNDCSEKNVAEIIIAKNRAGNIGTVKVKFK